jgi:TRAP-type mannitol/chloroaromatic compound transport system substrate-binding protein
MKRRKFIRTAGVGAAGVAAASAVAAPAIAQSMPEVKWRLTSSFPKSLDTLYGGSEMFAKMIGEMSDGKFQVRAFAAGEIVPGLQVADAVQNGTVEAGQTAAYYYFGKHPNFVFETGLPFTMNQRQYYAWCFFGGGNELINEFYKEYNFRSFIFGGTGRQMGGWFRKEIKSMDDMKGLKFRVGGFAGLILQRLGVVPQQIAGGDIYPALEKGTIDACEWVGPYDDEKLGFNKVAKYYYTPGVMELEATNVIMVGKQPWASLPPRYQAALRYAGNYAATEMLASYDAKNAQAIARLVASGTQLSVLPEDVIKALRGALESVLDEEAAGNAQFKKILANWRQFRAEQHRWFSIADTRAELAVYRTDPQR